MPVDQKLVIDCSASAGVAEAAQALLETAAERMRAGDIPTAILFADKARERLAAADSAGPAEQLLPLTPAELAQRKTDAATSSAAADTAHRAGLAQLMMRCDRLLAQTDWIMLPAAARPTDMSVTLAAACDANAAAWKDWRTQVKAIRDQAAAGTIDPAAAPAFPVQPSAPDVHLT